MSKTLSYSTAQRNHTAVPDTTLIRHKKAVAISLSFKFYNRLIELEIPIFEINWWCALVETFTTAKRRTAYRRQHPCFTKTSRINTGTAMELRMWRFCLSSAIQYSLHIQLKNSPKDFYYTGGMLTWRRTLQIMRLIITLFNRSITILPQQWSSPIKKEIIDLIRTCSPHWTTASVQSCVISNVRWWSPGNTRFNLRVQHSCKK